VLVEVALAEGARGGEDVLGDARTFEATSHARRPLPATPGANRLM
jgi:hypothetical protein